MRRFVLSLAAAAAVAGAPALAMAQANESDTMAVIGAATVESHNPSALTVRLSDGNTYKVQFAADFTRLAPGGSYEVKWVSLNGERTITAVRPAM